MSEEIAVEVETERSGVFVTAWVYENGKRWPFGAALDVGFTRRGAERLALRKYRRQKFPPKPCRRVVADSEWMPS